MIKTVALDAGHYTGTAGKRSPDNSFFEYEFNWDIVLKIQKHLTRCGINVVLTRDYADKEKTLSERVTIANTANADIFVSCHANAAGNGSWHTASGWEIYCYKLNTQAESLADKIENQIFPYFKTKYNIKNRGIKVSDFYVLLRTKMDAVLIENCFFTNKNEVELMKKQEFRRELAKSISKGICDFLSVKWKDETSPSSYFTYKATASANTDWVNVYTSSDKNDILGVLNKGAYIEIRNIISDKWVQVIYGASYGYIKTDQLNISYIEDTDADWRDEFIQELLDGGIINTDDYDIIKDSVQAIRLLYINHKNGLYK